MSLTTAKLFAHLDHSSYPSTLINAVVSDTTTGGINPSQPRDNKATVIDPYSFKLQ